MIINENLHLKRFKYNHSIYTNNFKMLIIKLITDIQFTMYNDWPSPLFKHLLRTKIDF